MERHISLVQAFLLIENILKKVKTEKEPADCVKKFRSVENSLDYFTH